MTRRTKTNTKISWGALGVVLAIVLSFSMATMVLFDGLSASGLLPLQTAVAEESASQNSGDDQATTEEGKSDDTSANQTSDSEATDETKADTEQKSEATDKEVKKDKVAASALTATTLYDESSVVATISTKDNNLSDEATSQDAEKSSDDKESADTESDNKEESDKSKSDDSNKSEETEDNSNIEVNPSTDLITNSAKRVQTLEVTTENLKAEKEAQVLAAKENIESVRSVGDTVTDSYGRVYTVSEEQTFNVYIDASACDGISASQTFTVTFSVSVGYTSGGQWICFDPETVVNNVPINTNYAVTVPIRYTTDTYSLAYWDSQVILSQGDTNYSAKPIIHQGSNSKFSDTETLTLVGNKQAGILEVNNNSANNLQGSANYNVKVSTNTYIRTITATEALGNAGVAWVTQQSANATSGTHTLTLANLGLAATDKIKNAICYQYSADGYKTTQMGWNGNKYNASATDGKTNDLSAEANVTGFTETTVNLYHYTKNSHPEPISFFQGFTLYITYESATTSETEYNFALKGGESYSDITFSSSFTAEITEYTPVGGSGTSAYAYAETLLDGTDDAGSYGANSTCTASGETYVATTGGGYGYTKRKVTYTLPANNDGFHDQTANFSYEAATCNDNNTKSVTITNADKSTTKRTAKIYYTSLTQAIKRQVLNGDGQTDDERGTIVIHKSHTINESVSTSGLGLALTIMNVNNPAVDAENPGKNGSVNNPPVVTFTGSGKLTCATNTSFSGVKFYGNSDLRTTAAILDADGCGTMTFDKGVGGSLSASQLEIKNFKFQQENTTNAPIVGYWADITFNDGEYKNNVSNHGGLITYVKEGGTVTINGGEWTGNSAYYDGGIIWFQKGTLKVTGGVFTGNHADRSGGVISPRTESTVEISGNPVMTGNTVTSTDYRAGAIAAYNTNTTSNGGDFTCKISGSPRIIGNGVGALGATPGTKMNLSMNTANSVAKLQVGTLTAGALIGYYSSTTTSDYTKQFATASGTTHASDCGNVNAFVNDVNGDGYVLGATTTTPSADQIIKWPENTNGVVKLTETQTLSDNSTVDVVHPFTSIQAAIDCAKDLGTATMKTYGADAGKTYFDDNTITKFFKIEQLVADINNQDYISGAGNTAAAATFNAGNNIPLVYTKASKDDSVYPFKDGDSDATVKQVTNNLGLFKLTDGKLCVTDVTLDGNSMTNNTANTGLVYQTGSSYLYIGDGTNNTTIKNGSTSWHGGGMYIDNSAKTSIRTNALITGNKTTGTSRSYGGGIYLASGTLQLEGGTIQNNASNMYGGGVFVGAGTFNMYDGTIGGVVSGTETAAANTAVKNGGGLSTTENEPNAHVNLYGGEISNNKATVDGGGFSSAIQVVMDKVTSENLGWKTISTDGVTITGNTAQGGAGGGAAIKGGKTDDAPALNLKEGKIESNTASTSGGGVYVTGSNATFTMSGGTIGGSSDKKNCVDEANTGRGGGIFANDGATVKMTGGEISYNEALGEGSNGGGVALIDETTSFTMEKPATGTTTGKISNNKSYDAGGGLYNISAKINLKAGEISNNQTTSSCGGGIYHSGSSTLTIEGSTTDTIISNNSAVSFGGGIYAIAASLDMKGGKISENKITGTGTYYGGAGIAAYASSDTTITISGGEISNHVYDATYNKTNYGGGILLRDGSSGKKLDLTISGDATIKGNKVYRSGGGVCVLSSSNATTTVTLSGGTIGGSGTPNSAPEGGGVYVNGGTLSVEGATISYNKATSTAGGGIELGSSAGSMSMSSGTISNNECGTAGAAIYYATDISISGGTIADNIVGGSTFGAVHPSTASNKVTVSGSPVIYNNLYNSKDQHNLSDITTQGTATQIKVDSAGLKADAKIGVFASYSFNKGDAFAKTYSDAAAGTTTTAKGSTNEANLVKFINDKNPALWGAAAATGENVVWTPVVCKVVEQDGTSTKTTPFMTLQGAFSYINDNNVAVLTGDDCKGTIAVKMVTPEYNQPSTDAVTISTGASKPITFTTAGSSDDLYPFQGTAGDVAVIKRGYTGATMFKAQNSPKLTITNLTIDGNKNDSNAYSCTEDGGILKTAGGELNLSSGTTLQNSSVTGTSTSYYAGVLYANNSVVTVEGATIKDNYVKGGGSVFAMANTSAILYIKDNTEISGNVCTGSSVIDLLNYSAVTISGGEIKDNVAQGTAGGVISASGSSTAGDIIMTGGTITGNELQGTSGNGGAIWASGNNVILSGGEISNNTCKGNGGAVYSRGAVELKEGGSGTSKTTPTIKGNGYVDSTKAVTYYGGGIYMDNAALTMSAGSIESNTASSCGGGVYIAGSKATFTMSGGTIGGAEDKKNVAVSGGGNTDGGAGIYAGTSSTVTITGGEISYNANTNSINGGGIYVNAATLNIQKEKKDGKDVAGTGTGVISNNSASAGGGIFNDSGTVTISSGKVNSNTATSNGGGINTVGYNASVTLSGDESSTAVSGNTCGATGAGVYIGRGSLSVQGGKISENLFSSAGNGGGIGSAGSNACTITVSGGEISGHTSKVNNGGGIYFGNSNKDSSLTISNGTIKGNTATGCGGGLMIANGVTGNITLSGGTIGGEGGTNNAGTGGGIYQYGGNLSVEGTTISYNKATTRTGGGIEVTNSAVSMKMSSGTISNNEAKMVGSAIYYSKDITITGGTISNNVVAAETDDAAVCTKTSGVTLTLGGNPTIYDNKYGSGTSAKQRNVYEGSDADVATQIKVDSSSGTDATPLLGSAKIGVYSSNNGEAGDQFAQTYSAPAAGTTVTSQTCKVASNLKCFINDKNTKLTGTYGKNSYAIWGSQEWLDLTAILPSGGSIYDSTWFVVELKDTTNGEIYRQAIEVGESTGGASATKSVLVRSGVPYEVTVKSNNGTFRYGFASGALDGSMKAKDSWSTTVSSGSTANGTLTLQPTDADTIASGQHELKIATKVANDHWLDDHVGITNTMVNG